jgi:hypothetical protein
MNEDIRPEKALNDVNLLIEKADTLLKLSYKESSKEKERLNTKIEGFIRAVFKDDNEKLEDYWFKLNHSHLGIVGIEYSEEEQQERYIEDLEIMKNHLLAYKDELELILDSREYDFTSVNDQFNRIKDENGRINIVLIILGLLLSSIIATNVIKTYFPDYNFIFFYISISLIVLIFLLTIYCVYLWLSN